MRIVLTKPVSYPDFIIGPGVLLDLPKEEAQQLLESESATQARDTAIAVKNERRKRSKARTAGKSAKPRSRGPRR